MSHNHDDNLFHSEVELSAWERLQVPKKLDLNQGTHASAEAWTLANETLSPKSAAAHVWDHALRWCDHFLKDIDNGVTEEPQVQMQVGGRGVLAPYQSFDSWPPPAGQLRHTGLRLHARGQAKTGTLSFSEAPSSGDEQEDRMFFHKGGPMTTGFFAVADIIKTLVPIKADLDQLPAKYGIVYLSPPAPFAAPDAAAGGAEVGRGARVCGAPVLSGLVVTPSAPQFLIMAFMYDLPPNSMTGELISHATRTVWREEGAKAVRHRRRCPPPQMGPHRSCCGCRGRSLRCRSCRSTRAATTSRRATASPSGSPCTTISTRPRAPTRTCRCG